MVIRKQACSFHVDREAIGVCVITKKPICAECSTRYEGVNYSKEGLRILKERRAEAVQTAPNSNRLIAGLCLFATPILLYMVELFYHIAMKSLIDIQQLSFTQ